MISPLTHQWTGEDVADMLGMTSTNKTTFLSAWDQPIKDKPEYLFLRAFSTSYGFSGPVFGAEIHRLLLEKVEAGMQMWQDGTLNEAVAGQTQDEFWSRLMLVVTPSGWGILTDSVTKGINQIRQMMPSDFQSLTNFYVIDVGVIYRLMTDFLALKAVGA
jgi:hypothetical protein